MTDLADTLAPDRGQDATTILLVDKKGLADWLGTQGERVRSAVAAARFKGEPDRLVIAPGDGPGEWSVIAGVKEAGQLSSWCLAALATALPAGSYRLAEASAGAALFGWIIAQHRFDRYRKPGDAPEGARTLLTTDVARIAPTIAEARAVAMVRDLVDTPASDCGPAELEAAASELAERHGATLTVTKGAPLDQGYPMIAAVGRAAAPDRAPRLIEIVWGRPDAPRIAIIGKGITFDSGGLDIKPASGMALMKKDMGGAAHALALARLVMEGRLPVRLHMLVASAENAIGGAAMRPGDILTSRKGVTVQIDNTDAEGRLVLGDALARAGEESPELIVDFATLTGAARVALGPDLPALFASDDELAAALLAAGTERDDPLWRLPLWDGYDEMLKSDLADITNAPSGGFAGAVTAALFLRRFVPAGTPWAHMDTFAWSPAARPGRPKGGAALGLRAAWGMLLDRYGE